ncbi:MAG: sugar ABC transporter ATP-binding protein [Eubacteriales bacterium]|nr:sugar ABC transporter ATP-binding protein [Eubacteriales bacterium]
MDGEVVLKAEHISKSFPGVKALDDVSIEIRAGEVHALCGENGAGKSTLLKVITGIYSMDAGEVSVCGCRAEIKNINDARACGIHVVPQEMAMAKHLTVAENIFLGRYPQTRLGIVDWKKMFAEAKQLQTKLGGGAAALNVRETVGHLSMGHKQLIEIMRAMIDDNLKVIAFDEPTSSLSAEETERLFELIADLRGRNLGIIYVSHRLSEIFRICDRVTVLKDGKFVDTRNVKEITNDDIVKMMVGRDLNLFGEKRAHSGEARETALRVENFARAGRYQNINFDAKFGEILGFYGLVGAGRTEIMRGIFAVDARDSGDVYIKGKKVDIKTPSKAAQMGIGFVTEDRRGEGLMLRTSLKMNISMPNLNAILNKGKLISDKKETQYAKEGMGRFNIKAQSERTIAGTLSGGNQQKAIIAKWVQANCDIIIFDEPTRGIDVGAKAEVYAVMKELADAGKCVIMISSELPETLGICDRIIVMREGEIMADMVNQHLTEEDIVRYAVAN